jgi:hypothetical protein
MKLDVMTSFSVFIEEKQNEENEFRDFISITNLQNDKLLNSSLK